MAERRMFTKKITESDAFLDMPMSAQCLYFHLNMSADDDGFVNNHRKIQRMIGASEDDFNSLVEKKFILLFESGVIVIKHWKMHNYIQSDRYKPTDYVDEKSMLYLKKNKAYTLDKEKMYTKCVQDVYIGKDKLGEDRLGKVNNNSLCKKDAQSLFEELWKLYPVKKGKGQVSDTAKMRLLKIGKEEMIKAIDRYKSYVAKKKNLSYQNGSTFFNSGYVDYIDKNYTPFDEESKTNTNNKFNNFESRNYDMSILEQQLVNR